MDRGEGIEGERAKEEANNLAVSSAVICDNIVRLLDFIERSKNEEDQIDDMDEIEKLKLNLTIMLRFFQFSYTSFGDFNATMSCKSYEVQSLDDVFHVLLRLLDYIKIYIRSQHHSKSSATMTEEQLVEFLDSILMKLHDLSSVESILQLMSQYEALQSVCGNIRDFHGLKVNGFIDHEIAEYLIPQFQLMAERVGHFCWVLLADQLHQYADSDEELDFPRVNVWLASLLVKIIPIQLELMHICFTKLRTSKSAEVKRFIKQLIEASPNILREYLIHLQHHMVKVTTASTSAKNIHVMIEFLLIILRNRLNNFIHDEKLFDLLARVGAITKVISILVRNLEGKSRNEESTNETDRATLYLLKNIELLKGDLKHIYMFSPDLSDLYFHMSDGPLFMNLLLKNLNDLLNSNAYSVALIQEEIELVKNDLEFIRYLFGNVEQELYQEIWKRVLDVAYEANYAINSILARDDGLLHLIFSLPNAIEKIKLIKEEVSNLPEKISKNKSFIALNSPNKTVENKSLTADQIIVGFKEETDWIIRKLTSGPTELDVISIIGMPGLGKSTLAYKVYNDMSVISHFDIRAWCTVDQGYNRRLVLQKIFNQVTRSDEKFGEDVDVDDVLRKKLYGRRYLIVLDDLWDTAAWDDLTRPFPQIEKGSRIILTSRKKEVALQGKRQSEPLNLRLLTPDESWELLEKRVFQEASCPVELLDIGKEIAQNCQGLPLVVDLIAGVIARRDKQKILWLELLKNLNSFIFENEVEVMRVIQLSYNHLSDHLKLCFLYLGSYRKDEQIEVSELKDLWSAEGFVEQTEMKLVEDVMEDYLDHLVSSSLVKVSRKEFGEKVCQIHDLVHDFCLIKARKEKLFDLISLSAPSSSSSSSSPSFSSDLMPRQVTVHYEEHLPRSYKNVVLFDSEKKRESSGKHLLSLKITGAGAHRIIFNLRHLRLLRVLNLDSYFIVTDFLLNEIGMLVHLRYINIWTNIEALPSSFSNLWNLETLVVDNDRCPMALEPVIWNLAKLRHVEIRSCFFSDFGTNEPTLSGEDSKLENLRILGRLKLSCSKGPSDISNKLPNVQKLECEIVQSWDSSAGCNWFPQFGYLNELEELFVFGPNDLISHKESLDPNDILSFEVRDPCDFPFFPSSLRSLTLGHGFVTSESLSTIARLPNLQDLRLRGLFIQGKEWNMQDGDTFENLKLLELFSMCFSEWQVGEESFPVLEHLILRYCKKLKEIPPSFGDIDSLKSIKLIDSPQLEDSALQIKQYVEEMTGDDKLQVLVHTNI